MADTVNTTASAARFEEAMAGRLRTLFAEVSWLKGTKVESPARDAGFDLLAKVPLPSGGSAALCIECKADFRPSAFHRLTEKSFHPPGRPNVVVPVLAMPSVSDRMADLCARHGWSWYDLAGNCRLDVPGVLHLQHRGHDPAHGAPRPTANLGTAEAGRVIRALLATDNAGQAWTQRKMKDHCEPGVSLGLVNKVVRHLRDEAYIEIIPNGGFRLRDPLKLLMAWRDVYRFDRHERRSYFTLLQGTKLRDALAHLDLSPGVEASYASFSAAEFQAPHVRQPKTWVYLMANGLPEFETLAQAKPVDSGENLVVLIPADLGIFYLGDAGDRRLPCTNAVQTYVDLWYSGGRGREAAEALLDQHLKPAWKYAGLSV